MPTYIKWPAPVGGVKLEYAPEILERLRLLSIDGLLALPRVGMAIGGFLTGSVDQGRVRISDSFEIPCSHAKGPTFALTGPELAKASAMAFGERRLQVVGWYCSRPRGELLLDPEQTRLFGEICPDPWQIGLLIRPSTVEPTRAAVCIRVGTEGYVTGQEMELLEYSPPIRQLPVEEVVSEVLHPDDDTVPEPVFALPPISPPVVRPEDPPSPVKQESPPTIKRDVPPATIKREVAPAVKWEVPAAVKREEPARIPFGREPQFHSQPAARSIRLYVMLAIVAMAIMAFLYINRFSILPRPPLDINISETAGQITLRWNPEALEGIDEGTVVLNDGGQFQTIMLDRRLLASGWLRSPRKSDRVIAKLTAGEVSGVSTWAPAPAEPAVNGPAVAPPAASTVPGATAPLPGQPVPQHPAR